MGEGVQKFGPLPAAHTDGVFAIIGEELGLIGCLVVIALLLFMTWRGLRIARKAATTTAFCWPWASPSG
jgi:cell division protein FtsW